MVLWVDQLGHFLEVVQYYTSIFYKGRVTAFFRGHSDFNKAYSCQAAADWLTVVLRKKKEKKKANEQDCQHDQRMSQPVLEINIGLLQLQGADIGDHHDMAQFHRSDPIHQIRTSSVLRYRSQGTVLCAVNTVSVTLNAIEIQQTT